MRTFIAVNGRCSRSSSYSGCDRGSGHANRASRSHPMPVTSSSLTRCPLSVHSPPSASPTGQSWAVLDFNRSDDEISGRFLTSFDEMRVPLLPADPETITTQFTPPAVDSRCRTATFVPLRYQHIATEI